MHKSYRLLLSLIVLIPTLLFSQAEIKVQKSPKASVSQRIGKTDITISYHRPAVKGRTIWGDLVPFGMGKDKEGNDLPWRAGANENTTITFSTDVTVSGKMLKAGTYGVHMLVGEKKSTFIFSNRNDAWGSYGYNPKDDALRIDVKNAVSPHQEWLSYSVTPIDTEKATVTLAWEKLSFSFQIEL